MKRLLRLYPRAWQARYGDELEALLALRPVTLGDHLDLLLGALDAHLHPELVEARSPAPDRRFADVPAADVRVARRLGIGAIVGAAVWLSTWVIAANGPIVTDEWGTYRDGSAAGPVAILAGALLAAGILGQFIVLPARARVARVAGIVAIAGILLWSLAPWQLPLGLLGLIGLCALGAAAWRHRIWSAPAAAVLGFSIVGAAIAVAASADRMGGLEPAPPTFTLALILLTVPWLVVGGTLLRLPQGDVARA